MTPEHRTREHPEATDPLREALDELLEALQRVDVSGQIGDVEDYDEAVHNATAALAAAPESEWEYRAISGLLLSRVARTVPEAQRLAETINFYPPTRIERRRKAGEWEALPDD